MDVKGSIIMKLPIFLRKEEVKEPSMKIICMKLSSVNACISVFS